VLELPALLPVDERGPALLDFGSTDSRGDAGVSWAVALADGLAFFGRLLLPPWGIEGCHPDGAVPPTPGITQYQ